jgi:hypothetical protein
MTRLDESILEFVKRNGPSTPIEVASKVGANSLIVTAILIDAVSQKKIKRSKRSMGSMHFFYYPEQTNVLQKKISNLLTPADKEMLQKLMKENVIGEHELKPQEIPILKNLEDLINGVIIEHGGRPFRCWVAPNIPEEKAKELATNKITSQVEIKTEEVTAPKVVEVKPEPKVAETKAAPTPAKVEQKTLVTEKKTKKAEKKLKAAEKEKIKQEVLVELKGGFKDLVSGWLEKQNIDVLDEKVIKEGKEYELSVKIPTPLGKQKYMVKVLNLGKRKTGQSIISSVGTEAATKRIPAVIISSSGFAKTAKKYWEKELQDLVTLVSKEDLE